MEGVDSNRIRSSVVIAGRIYEVGKDGVDHIVERQAIVRSTSEGGNVTGQWYIQVRDEKDLIADVPLGNEQGCTWMDDPSPEPFVPHWPGD